MPKQLGWSVVILSAQLVALISVLFTGSVARADEVFVSSMEDGEPVDRFVNPKEVGSTETIERTQFLADLAAKGVEVSWPRISSSLAPRVLTPKERRASKLKTVLDYAYTQADDELVEVLVTFDVPPFDQIADLRAMDPAQREDVLRQREDLVKGIQNDFVLFARSQGAEVLGSIWIINQLRVALPPRLAESILKHPDVRDVYPGWYKARVDWDGGEIRNQTYLQRLLDIGFDGEHGGRVDNSGGGLGGDNIKIALIEGSDGSPNFVNNTHRGWRDWSNGPSRIVWRVDCMQPGCPTDTTNHADVSHSTWVAWTAAGSILQGQDPDCVNENNCSTAEQERRSGIASEAELFVIRANSIQQVAYALFLAFLGGADIANLSQSFDACGFCLADTDCGLEAIIRSVTDGGMLVVTSSGNYNNDTGLEYNGTTVNCNVGYPGQRPEIVTVGGIGSKLASGSYAAQTIGPYSSRGWVSVGLGGWLSGAAPIDMPVVAITAPAVIEYYFWSGVNRYGTAKIDGTSFSSPVIAAGAGLFRESMPYSGDPDARMLKALLMVMGDGTGSRSVASGLESGSAHDYGSGKFRGHRFHNLQQPAGNVRWKFTIAEGQQKTLNLPLSGSPLHSSVKQWKWAAYIDQTDLTQVPYLLVIVTDPCNAGAVLGSDNYLALHKHVFMTSAGWSSGACPRVSVYGYSVPPGGVTVYAAAYYHSGNPNEH